MSKKFMQPTLIAGAVLALTAGVAQAQSSVTVYGIIDVGLEHQTDAPRDSVTRVQSGGLLPSIWGLKGSEDLGGGLKAVFNLEGDFAGDTGGSRGLGNISTLFGRQANVGLSAGWGTVLLGRQYAPALLAELGTDPRGYKESYSMLLPYALALNPTGNDLGGANNGAGIFTSNMVSYTGAFGPVTVRAGYGLGETAGNTSDNSTISFGATYSGPITVSLSYMQVKSKLTTVDTDPGPATVNVTGDQAEAKRFGVGVSVPFGDLTFKALYAKSDADFVDGSEISDADTFGVGVNWAWNPQNTLTVAYYHSKDKAAGFGGKSNDFVISNDYALSKRTTLYAQFVQIDVDGDANKALSLASYRGVDNVGTDGKTSILGVGIKHSF